jgi:hypothetical protein
MKIDMEELNGIVRRLAKLTRQPCNIFNIIGALDPMVKLGFRGMWLPNLVLFGQRLPSRWSPSLKRPSSKTSFTAVGAIRARNFGAIRTRK